MEKVEFLLKCIEDGKLSNKQACATLGNRSDNDAVTGAEAGWSIYHWGLKEAN